MFLVGPRDVSTDLADLLLSPDWLRSYVQAHWNASYADKIVESQSIPLTGKLAGLLLMQTRSMVERIANGEGISYRAGDEAHNFVRYLTSPYFRELRQAATFLIDLRKRLWKV